MSKTVTIPADVSRMEITINDKTYTYAGGATVTVPDEVAALLESNKKILGTRPVADPQNAGIYDGNDYIEVYTTADGVLRIKKSDVAAAAGGSDLPEVDASDNGKVLTVVSGEWAAAAAGGGALWVTFTVADSAATADKTLGEIDAAINAGRPIYGIDGDANVYHVSSIIVEEGVKSINELTCVYVASDAMQYRSLLYDDGGWLYSENEYTLTPAE